ncbi:putative acyl-activating enzyme 6 [Dorcoceras hygrometricum]|uniref:Putative acyl-activating enzyme 6 n=1 Tax=Dorcoceras hygrometricum TaxID=472368 RepID=A0A2Z7ALQ0_9LAMI|nr:putative acyl-activating enzyme 6 [Dorcoceras hygrometricum]
MEELKRGSANSTPLTPLTFLERAATVYGDCISVIYNSMSYTWCQTHERCLKMASSIVSLGIQRGRVVSVMAPNVPAMYELQFAVPMAGYVLNNINTRLDSRTVSVILRHSESKLVFVDFQLLGIVLEAISLFSPKFQPPLVILIERDEKGLVSMAGIHDTYEAMVRKGASGFKWLSPENEWEPMTLNYTSGTTSSPKGVVHSHRSIFVITFDSLINWSVPKQPVYLWTLPMFHSNGWSYTWGMAAVGGTNVCLRKFDARVVYESIYRYNVTHMCGAPVILNMLANYPGARPLKSPIQFLTGGAPPPAAVVLRTESLGFSVTHGYGLTEVAGVVVSCAWKSKWNAFPATERARLKARQGVRTLGVTAADVVDPESGKSVKRDGSTMGEIVLRGACLMLGYLKNPEATSKCMRGDGWLYTGDVGVMHPDGYLEIKDRSKDIIISGGENVSSVEVESVLYSNPAVNEAAVVARPDDYWGETPCAFLSLKEGVSPKPPAENEMIEFCRTKLPHYMVPRTVVFMSELPKTATGKVQKFTLRDIAYKMGSMASASRL